MPFPNSNAWIYRNVEATNINLGTVKSGYKVIVKARALASTYSVTKAKVKLCATFDKGRTDKSGAYLHQKLLDTEFCGSINYMRHRSIANIHYVHVYWFIETYIICTKRHSKSSVEWFDSLCNKPSIDTIKYCLTFLNTYIISVKSFACEDN